LIARRTGAAWLAGLTLAVAAAACLAPRFAQPLGYHRFADARGLFGIPNFGDVASNLPFAAIGAWGLAFLWRSRRSGAGGLFLDPRERWPYLFVFLGLLLTAFGSAYYHLHPCNATLLWDRLPMTVTFMAMVAAVIAERVSLRLGLWLLPALLAIGLASVLAWDRSERAGAGDLRFYAAVQAYAALVILLALFLPPRYTRTRDYAWVLGFYALAKLLELFDKPIFAALRLVSGHTLKHLAAAMAGYWILRMVQKRQPLEAAHLKAQ
jgi:hypothetical protein